MLNGNNSFYQNMFTSIQNGEGEFLMDTNAPNLATKDITENGEYNASSDNADGYSSVTVNVPAPTPETFEVEMTVVTSSGTSEAFTTSKTLQETINAIQAGKQIDFLATFDGIEWNVICYGVFSFDSVEAIIMMASDGRSTYSVYWIGDENANTITQCPLMIVGAHA